MNRYTVRFQSDDKRVWEVTVKADGITDRDGLVVFWRRWGWLKRTAHVIAKSALISVIGDAGNE